MSSNMKFITNTKGDGDWCIVILDGEIIHQGHDLSFYNAFELVKYYGGFNEYVSYIELTNEQMQKWEEYT